MPTGTEVGLRPCHIMLDGDPFHRKEHIIPTLPHIWQLSVVALWSPISAIAEPLYKWSPND